jgi:2-dehydrotetronate isomerase
MPKFAANLSMMYQEHGFLDRFAAAAKDGFQAVEFLFPYGYPAQEISTALTNHGLTLALCNAPPGDWQAGERGLAALPGRKHEFRQSIEKALAYATVLGNKRLHVMAGLAPSQDHLARSTYLENLAHAAQEAALVGITVVIEPINTRDMPGYFLNRQADAHAVCKEVGAANLMVQMDLYHCQIVEGDLAVKLRTYMTAIGHIQVAGVPDRHEPDQGELNYPYLFQLIDELGYSGWIGCEYRPRGQTSAGLTWLRPYQ